MNKSKLYEMALRLRETEDLPDIAIIITRRDGKFSDVLWWSKGKLRKELKRKLYRGGVAEGFFLVANNGDGRWKMTVRMLDGADEKRGQVLLWNYGRKHRAWESRLH